MKFDTSKWGEFKIGDLFTISTPKKKFNAEKLEFNGQYPYVVRSDKNNGIRGYISEKTDYLNEANSISFGQDTATMFYQNKAYFTGDKIKIFKFKENELSYKFNQNLALYLIAVLKHSFKNFNWGSNSYNVTILENIKLSLPINKDSKPDWEFMESTIKATQKEMAKIIKAYELLITRISNGGGELRQNTYKDYFSSIYNTSYLQWKEFKLVDLFNYERGTRITKNDRTEGKYPLVTAGEYNQGVKEYISNENQKIFKSAITIDMFCNCFVHIDDFCCDDNVLVLTAKQNISKQAMQFISTIINKDKEKWGYIKQYRQNSLENIIFSCLAIKTMCLILILWNRSLARRKKKSSKA